MKSPLIKTNCPAFQLQNYKSLSIFIEENLYLASSSPSPPRSSTPHRSLCLVPGSARSLPFRYRHGSYLSVPSVPLTRPALPFPILQASSRRSTSCLSRLTHKPKLLPFAAMVAHRRCQRKRTPSASTKVRALTTTFRSDGQTMAPYLRRCLLAPLQSVVRSLALPPP